MDIENNVRQVRVGTVGLIRTGQGYADKRQLRDTRKGKIIDELLPAL